MSNWAAHMVFKGPRTLGLVSFSSILGSPCTRSSKTYTCSWAARMVFRCLGTLGPFKTVCTASLHGILGQGRSWGTLGLRRVSILGCSKTPCVAHLHVFICQGTPELQGEAPWSQSPGTWDHEFAVQMRGVDLLSLTITCKPVPWAPCTGSCVIGI